MPRAGSEIIRYIAVSYLHNNAYIDIGLFQEAIPARENSYAKIITLDHLSISL